MSKYDKPELQRLIDEHGYNRQQIASRLGITQRRLYDLHLNFPPAARLWTRESEETLRQLWAADASLNAIAKHFCVAKGAIVGKARRLDLPGRQPAIVAQPAAPVPRTLRPSITNPIWGLAKFDSVSANALSEQKKREGR